MTKLSELTFSWNDVIKLVGVVMLFEATYSGIKSQFNDVKEEVSELTNRIDMLIVRDSANRAAINVQFVELKKQTDFNSANIEINTHDIKKIDEVIKSDKFYTAQK